MSCLKYYKYIFNTLLRTLCILQFENGGEFSYNIVRKLRELWSELIYVHLYMIKQDIKYMLTTRILIFGIKKKKQFL